MISLLWPFFYSCILCLFSHHFYGLFYHLFFRDISLKSQETFVYFSVMFHLLFSGFLFCLTFFVELSFKLSNSYSFIYSYLYIRYLFGYNYSFIHPYTYWFSSLFLSCLAIRYFLLSCSYFSSCLAVLINYFVFVVLC